MDMENKDLPRGENVPEAEVAAQKTDFGYEIYTLLHDFVYILAAVTTLFVFIVRLVGVDGSSMFPTLNDRDYMILLSNFVDTDYDQGDIVVMHVPAFETQPIVKRVIATAGQEVYIDFDGGVVYVDGQPLSEDYTYEPTYLNYENGLAYPATVPEGCVFVMGDNRNNSTDSRYAPVGMVDTRRIMGRVLCIAFPGRETDAYNTIVGGRQFGRIGAVK